MSIEFVELSDRVLRVEVDEMPCGATTARIAVESGPALTSDEYERLVSAIRHEMALAGLLSCCRITKERGQ